jgi:hypothetical protein
MQGLAASAETGGVAEAGIDVEARVGVEIGVDIEVGTAVDVGVVGWHADKTIANEIANLKSRVVFILDPLPGSITFRAPPMRDTYVFLKIAHHYS